ncbi:40S ribosomal protein S8 [Guillardia theta]|uniref:40S ribosomal protein S8 n=1 Tax=Guillardia theta TaxID=55529 RepID=Q9AW20_GUITH|nr:40S ribosomal protein S8 [Guillardia theta]CAC27051.1 40S ribosomal protein S8 [Guillardia theta]|mmetsp:Transcript_23965/g.77917  ORF Transcript_23965/g.77917 Transcript_23965/m.77917 type:complete len:179 (+) Transcript_23965:739-1275(+)
MGINREGLHKRKSTGGLKSCWRKKRNHAKGRQPSNTKIGRRCVVKLRVRGGGVKTRALFLSYGNFSFVSIQRTFKAKILSVAFNESSNELVRTNTLTKGSIVYLDIAKTLIYNTLIRNLNSNPKIAEDTISNKILIDQILSGKILARICSRPGQSGRADGYILEGQELDYFLKKIQKK